MQVLNFLGIQPSYNILLVLKRKKKLLNGLTSKSSVTVLVICGLARWKEVERPQTEGPLWDLDQIKTIIFNKVPTCEGVGIASILIGLLYL